MAVNTSGAPITSSGHSAVWTGNEMIVWRGSLNAGRYNPGEDGWAALTLTSGPLARSNHTAVWTGNRMIVWGGANTSAGNNIYYNDTWSLTPGKTMFLYVKP